MYLGPDFCYVGTKTCFKKLPWAVPCIYIGTNILSTNFILFDRLTALASPTGPCAMTRTEALATLAHRTKQIFIDFFIIFGIGKALGNKNEHLKAFVLIKNSQPNRA
jgi:hypothetical protein